MCLGPGLLPNLDSTFSAYMMPIIVCTIPYISCSTTLRYGYLEHSNFCSSVITNWIWKPLVLSSRELDFLDDFCDHPCLIHVEIEICIACDVDSYELLVRTVGDCVFVSIEVLNQRIPFVEDILRSEPSEVIAVSYDKQGLAVDPFAEELEVLRCV